MKKVVGLALVLAVAGGAQSARARETCPQHFAGGVQPKLVNARLQARTTPLCFRAFAVLHSGASRTPLWSAERLTAASVRAAIRMEGRSNRFHAEERLPATQRAELDDYARSGFDRGHMAPSGNMPSRVADDESFSLANVVPQAPRLNQGTWSKLESMVRDMALSAGEAHVVTGPLYEGQRVRSLKARVLVPTSTWKAVHIPGQGAAAYVATNSDSPRWRLVSVAELARRSGVDPFPALSATAKAKAAPFPLPTTAPPRRRPRP